MKKVKKESIEIDSKYLTTNTVFLGDRKEIYPSVKEAAQKLFENQDVFEKKEVVFFEIEKLNLSVDDIRRMISFANRTSEGVKVIMLSSFYWSDEAQNAMLKVLEETPANTHMYIFGLSEKNFLSTIMSRVQKVHYKNVSSYIDIAVEVLELHPNERLENKNVKKILALKTVDMNYEKNTENEKKDREAHVLFLSSLITILIENREEAGLDKQFMEKILKISTLAEIEGGSPHLFIEWVLLASPRVA